MYKNHNPSQRFWEEHDKHLTDITIRGYAELFKQHNPNVIEEDIEHFITMWKRLYD